MIAADGVKRGTGVRRLADCDRWVALQGLPWEVTARRSPGTPREKPLSWLESQGWRCHQQFMSWRHLCRRGSTSGRQTSRSTRLQMGAQDAHAFCWANRIVTLMQQDEEGKSRLEEHERKKRSKRDEKNEAPERDVTADDAAGALADKAVQASEERRDEGILPYPEERSSLKRAPAEPSSSSTPAGSKAKASPVKPQKRPGELRIAAGPKLKVQPPQGEKREPEAPVEEKRDQTGEPPAGATTPGQPPDAGGLSLSRAKEVVKRMIERRIKQVYEQQE